MLLELLGVVSVGIAFLWMRRLERGKWRIDNMLKGAEAEERMGHAIEWALTSNVFAVAHDTDRHRLRRSDRMELSGETGHRRSYRNKSASALDDRDDRNRVLYSARSSLYR